MIELDIPEKEDPRNKYQEFTQKEISDLESYLDSVKLSLLTSGINIYYHASGSKDESFVLKRSPIVGDDKIRKLFTYIHSKSLEETKVKSLFPSMLGISDIDLIKISGDYILRKKFRFGEMLAAEELFSRFHQIREGDEWKLKGIENYLIVLPVDELIDLAKNLAKVMTEGEFIEVDRRDFNDYTDYCCYKTDVYPRLEHEFNPPIIPSSNKQLTYLGSILNFEEKIRDFKQISLEEDLIKYHQFMEVLK